MKINFLKAKEELNRLLSDSKPNVKPLACLYSGGLDSGTAHYYWGGIPWTVIWEKYDTLDDACGGMPILITKQECEHEMSNIFRCFDRPVCETGIFPLYFAYKKLAELGFKYIVTGDGGDELFLGYKWDKLTYFKKDIPALEIINHLYAKHVYIAESISKNFGVKIISPFLKKEIIKFVLNLPLRYKTSLFKDKIILRELMKDKIRLRSKYYFHNPIQKWFNISRKEKYQWFLQKWLETRMISD